MKHWRIGYYGLAIGWLLVGLSSGIRVFYVLFFAQLFLLLLAAILNFWAAFSFAYLQEAKARQTLRGQPVDLSLKIHNEKILPYPMMNLTVATPTHRGRRQLQFNLPPKDSIDFDLKLDCPHRGDYEIGMTIINFTDIFGILRFPFDMRMLPYYRSPRLLVYPHLHELNRLPLPTLDSQSFSRQRFATEDQTEPFSTLRKYQRGDTRKLIHWKASLKHQTLLTRQFEEAAEPHILLLLDMNRPPWPGEEGMQAIDALCESAVSLIHYFLRQDWILHLKTLGSDDPEQIGQNMADFQKFYTYLAQAPFSGNVDFAHQLDESLQERTHLKAIILLSMQHSDEITRVILKHHRSTRPVFSVFAAPSRSENDPIASYRDKIEKSGLPAWFIHYGEQLSEKLRRESP